METKDQTSLSPEQLHAGAIEARKFINQAAGYYFAGELTPFVPELKELALRAIDQLEANTAQLEALKSNPIEAEVEVICRDCGTHMGGMIAGSKVKWVVCQKCQSSKAPASVKEIMELVDKIGSEPFLDLRSKIESSLNGLMCGVALLQAAKSQLTKEVEQLQEENAALVADKELLDKVTPMMMEDLSALRETAEGPLGFGVYLEKENSWEYQPNIRSALRRTIELKEQPK